MSRPIPNQSKRTANCKGRVCCATLVWTLDIMVLSSQSPSFAPPLRHSSRHVHQSIPIPTYRLMPLIIESNPSTMLHMQESFDVDMPPIGAPLVVLVAVILAFAAQSWINSLLGGDQGLGAFLSDGTGFNKSGFKPRSSRPITDERSIPGDTTKPLGGDDPLPWLKLPELDYVDVAGQSKRPKQTTQTMKTTEAFLSSVVRDESDVIVKLEMLREQMKTAFDRGDLEDAKRIENELERIMKEEGYSYQ